MYSLIANQMSFVASDDLAGRYGADVPGIMGAHAFDLAIRILGKPRRVNLRTDGVYMKGNIAHLLGESLYSYSMNTPYRVSMVACGPKIINLTPDDAPYKREMEAFLTLVETGKRDPRLATLADGLAVVEVLAQVR